jgi:hypothetical protein
MFPCIVEMKAAAAAIRVCGKEVCLAERDNESDSSCFSRLLRKAKEREEFRHRKQLAGDTMNNDVERRKKQYHCSGWLAPLVLQSLRIKTRRKLKTTVSWRHLYFNLYEQRHVEI